MFLESFNRKLHYNKDFLSGNQGSLSIISIENAHFKVFFFVYLTIRKIL